MWPFPMESAHPLIVHFPIALLLTAVGLELAALALRRPALQRAALWNLCLGALGAGAAVWTGLRAADVAKHTFEIHRVIELHQRLGFATLWLALGAAAVRLFTRDRLAPWARLAVALAMLAMTVTVAYGAHLGGRLVYEFGVGGQFGSPEPHTDTAPSHHHSH